MPDNDSNGRVTLAIIDQKLIHICERVDEFIETYKGGHADHEERIRENESAIVELRTKLGLTAGVLTALTIVLSAIAAFFGN